MSLLIATDPKIVSFMINFFFGGFAIAFGFFTYKYQSLKILSGYDEKKMPYIDKKRLSAFIGLCLMNAGLIVIIPNLIVTLIFPDYLQIVGIVSYVIFALILIFMVLKTNKEGRPGGKFSNK